MIYERGSRRVYAATNPKPGETYDECTRRLTEEGWSFCEDLETSAGTSSDTLDILKGYEQQGLEVDIMRTEVAGRITVIVRKKCEKAA